MKVRSNSITLLAICSSILLLSVLQIFWLRMEFKDEMSRFHRESHMIFRNTVLELNDSIVQKNIMAIGGGKLAAVVSHDTTNMAGKEGVVKVLLNGHQDSIIENSNGERSAIADSLPKKRMMFRFRVDSLDRDMIHRKYIEQLSSAGLDMPVELVFVDNRSLSSTREIIVSDDIVQTPSGSFKLEFSDLNLKILKNIAPQISFSIILSLLVIGSFVLVYRNLLLQQKLVVMKDGLISNISHELKTPITTVGVALEGLKNFKGQHDPVVSSEYLSIAENELKRLSLLTDKVLKTSIEGMTNVSSHIVSFDLKELISDVIQSFKLIAEKKGATITLDIEEGEYLMDGDQEDISTIIFNLLDNALKYSGQNALIQVRLKDLKEMVSVEIQDNGIGISKSYQSKIFEKFFRVPTGDVHTVKGYGLGLSYVRQVANRHQGKIYVESELNSGSKFTICLPKTHAKK